MLLYGTALPEHAAFTTGVEKAPPKTPPPPPPFYPCPPSQKGLAICLICSLFSSCTDQGVAWLHACVFHSPGPHCLRHTSPVFFLPSPTHFYFLSSGTRDKPFIWSDSFHCQTRQMNICLFPCQLIFRLRMMVSF